MPDLWASSCLRLSASSLFLHSRKRLFFSSGGFVFDRIGIVINSRKAQKPSSTVSGFRVYSSGRASRPILSLCSTRSLCSLDAGTHLVGRLASHFEFSLRRVAYCSWIAPPRPVSPLVVRIPIRSLKKDGGPEGEVEVESSFRSRQPASAKRNLRTVNKVSSSSRKGQQRAPEREESSLASGDGPVKRVGVRAKTHVSGGKDGQSGNELLDGRGSNFRGVKNSSNQFGGKFVAVGSVITKSNVPTASGKFSRAPNSLKRSRCSGVASAAATVVEDLPGDPKIGLKGVPDSSSAMNSNRRKQGGGDDSKPKQQTEKKLKKKDFPVEAQLRRDLNNCSKDGDVLRALEIYDRSVAEGVVKWNQYNFNILLYLCSSAALGTLAARKSGTDRSSADRLNLITPEQNSDGTLAVESTNGVEHQDNCSNGEAVSGEASTTTPLTFSPEIMELAAQRGFEIFEDMKKQEVPPNEATLTAVARLAIKREDGNLAFQMVKEMAAQNIAPKLRSYSPALVAFCKSKAVEKAFEVDAHMVAAGVEPEEPELGALLQLCVEERLDKHVYTLLHRLRTRVRALSPSTISSIEEWFSGQAGASAGEGQSKPEVAALHQAMVAGGGGWHGLGWLGQGQWKVEWSTIDNEGSCCSCKNKLVTIDLDPRETEDFAKSVAELAFARETKSNDFRRFQEWLDRHAPFGAIIDGANVGLYNQNFTQGGFNFWQLNSIAQAAQERGLVKTPPLIILHHGRTKFGAANSPLGQQLLKKWNSSDTLYSTPNGSNDDWYWLYAAVRNKCLLITNDEMRDHLFQLLGSDFFPKWKERHQVRFSATSGGLQFHLPPPYSLVIQESENGSWHIPKDRGSDVDAPHEWMCVTRSGISVNNAALPVSVQSSPPEETVVASLIQTPHDTMVNVDQAVTSPKVDSQQSDGIIVTPKRSRSRSPSSATLKKIRAADKQSTSGPVMFDI
ncbi:unnamed protein product [Calypogeia fissa]